MEPDLDSEDYYAILGVNPTATADEIKQAYRRGALHWHPDKNPSNSERARANFQKISHAYEVLSSPDRRRQYDEIRNGATVAYNGPARFNFTDPMRFFEEVFAFMDPTPGGRSRGGGHINVNVHGTKNVFGDQHFQFNAPGSNYSESVVSTFGPDGRRTTKKTTTRSSNGHTEVQVEVDGVVVSHVVDGKETIPGPGKTFEHHH